VDRSDDPARAASQGSGRTLLGVARFDAAAYRSIAIDRRFLGLSLSVVVLAAVSHAGLGLAWARRGGWEPINSIVPASLSHFAMWLGLSVVGFVVGRALGGKGSLNGFARAVGVASFPATFYLLGVVVESFLFVMAAWWIASTYIAVRGSLQVGAAAAVASLATGVVGGYLLAVITTNSVLDWLK
jgi:hypothetical protein